MAFVNERKEKVWESRTIDYERNAVLTLGSTQNWYIRVGSAESFTLSWRGEKIEFGALYKFQNLGSSKKMLYFIERCVYPEALIPFRKEVIEMVVQALTVFGISYGTDDGTKIQVKISPELRNLQVDSMQNDITSPETSKSFH